MRRVINTLLKFIRHKIEEANHFNYTYFVHNKANLLSYCLRVSQIDIFNNVKCVAQSFKQRVIVQYMHAARRIGIFSAAFVRKRPAKWTNNKTFFPIITTHVLHKTSVLYNKCDKLHLSTFHFFSSLHVRLGVNYLKSDLIKLL